MELERGIKIKLYKFTNICHENVKVLMTIKYKKISSYMQNIKVYKIKNPSAQATRGQQNTSSCRDDT